MISRRDWFRIAAGGAAIALTGRPLRAHQAATTMTVYKSPTCGCCTKWIAHVEQAGFAVTAHDVPDVRPYKQKYGVPHELSSCHTGLVAGYAIEGHVPADLIQRLLREKPDAAGLAVPGMPMGSPGMEGHYQNAYDVVLIGRDGTSGVYATR